MQSKRNLAVAIGLIFASLSGAAVAAPTLYGELDVSVDYLPENNRAGTPDRDVVEVSSNSSFIGVKGDEALTDRLSAVYAAEWTINTDGDGTDLGQRNRFVGLKDKQLGTLKVGKNDTPVKQLSSVVDTFNNYTGNKADIGGIFTGENRIDNVVIYESPALDIASGKLNVTALLATGEASGIAKSSGGAKVAGRGLGDAWSASVVYANPTFVAGLGYDKAIPSNFAGRGFLNASAPETANGVVFAAANTVRAIGRLNVVEGLALKALYQTSDVEDVQGNDAGAANIDKADGWLLGGEYTLPQAKAWTVKAQYSQNSTSYKAVTADYDAKQIIAGVDYAFSKQAKAYGYGGYLTLEQAGNKDKQPVLGAGLEYKF